MLQVILFFFCLSQLFMMIWFSFSLKKTKNKQPWKYVRPLFKEGEDVGDKVLFPRCSSQTELDGNETAIVGELR